MAKLVEILARDLERWPEGVRRIGQDNHGITLFEPQPPRILAELVSEIADDSHTAIVTRAEWQAAVDALKAKDINSSTAAMIDAGWVNPKPPVSPSLHAQVVGRANRIPEWDGVGLPPVGVSCERGFPGVRGGSWNGCIILAHGARRIFVRDNCGDEWAPNIDEVEFRPFRTPERIAAYELRAIIESGLDGRKTLDQVIEEIIGAGYRKQGQK